MPRPAVVRCKLDPLLLDVGSLLLALRTLFVAVGALAKVGQTPLHLPDRSREIRKLARNGRYVVFGGHAGRQEMLCRVEPLFYGAATGHRAVLGGQPRVGSGAGVGAFAGERLGS